jgi:hypothetical protein
MPAQMRAAVMVEAVHGEVMAVTAVTKIVVGEVPAMTAVTEESMPAEKSVAECAEAVTAKAVRCIGFDLRKRDAEDGGRGDDK